jgi:Glycosyl transferase 4-like domain
MLRQRDLPAGPRRLVPSGGDPGLARRHLRILYSHRILSRDGMSVHLEELVAALRGAGHEVLVVVPRAFDAAGFGGESRVIGAIRRRLPPAIGAMAEVLYNIPAVFRLRRAHKEFAPDVLYERYNLYHLAGVLLKWRYRVPYYIEVNAPLAEERARFGRLGLPRLARPGSPGVAVGRPDLRRLRGPQGDRRRCRGPLRSDHADPERRRPRSLSSGAVSGPAG